ncbi:CBASS cGAMP-activated phospholipase [Microcoleus sp. FACHB-672]|uniref:CBASS cGAMP-activated phospholipase n=1 Tax=Microcoleus sp. FACHB-672 TaxID=2692825 RepID=UPI001687D573|nr:CBASS cGAMP-activated phospholipase [Microcoleus sp. FACHB-672]MBD2043675.1 patatin-like phospholipase family protein [Microcoleus sp. FACHB-672]
MSNVVKVLAIDGGGIRGIIPAMVLAEIEARTQKRISEMFDLIAGTSTGGLLALALTKPKKNSNQPQYKATNLVRMYEEEGEIIFSPKTFARLRSLTDEKYPADGIEAVLEKYFGNTRLSQALTEIIVPSYDIEQRRPHFFKSRKAKNDYERDFPMRKVARATSAAPTYFEPLKLENHDLTDYYALIDGGVFANNPAMCAYVEAKDTYPDATDFLVVSLGTGELSTRLFYDHVKDWGLLQWAQPILHVVFDGSSDTVDYQLRLLLPALEEGTNRYYRFQTSLIGDVGDHLDDANPKNITGLKRLAQDMINKNDTLLNTLCQQLVSSIPTGNV